MKQTQINYKGQAWSQTDLAKELGIGRQVVARLHRAGIPAEEMRAEAAKATRRPTGDGWGQGAISRYLAGESGTQIAASLGVSTASVYKVLDDAGIPRRETKKCLEALNDSQQSEVADRHKTGASIWALAEEYKVSTRTIRKACARNGVTANTGGAPRSSAPRKPRGFWFKQENLIAELTKYVAEHGLDKLSAEAMQQSGNCSLLSGVRLHGGFAACRRLMGYPSTLKPGDWTKEKLLQEVREYVNQHGEEAFTSPMLRMNGRGDINGAISRLYRNRINDVKVDAGIAVGSQSPLTWADRGDVDRRAVELVAANGEQCLTGDWLRAYDRGYLSGVIRHGGIAKLRKRIGVGPGNCASVPPGHWDDWENVVQAYRDLHERLPDFSFTLRAMRDSCYGLLQGAGKHPEGHIGALRAAEIPVTFTEIAGSVPSRAVALSMDLQGLVESLGEHINALPQKSWLAILQHSKALKVVGRNSALAPIKVRLLEGKITPADITRPEVEPGEEPKPSKLEEELTALVEAAGEDAVDEDEEYTAEPSSPAESPEPLDITDEPEEQRRALLNLKPELLIGAVSAVAKVCPDEQLLDQLCRTQTDQQWASVFAADAVSQAAAQQVVDQIIATPAVDVWAAKVRDSFLADWRLMEEAGPIPGLQMPAGERLNLMQRREAALLLRDRARLNISGMGAGKTRSAICGAQLSGRSRVLVLCPNNAITTWQAELAKCLPTAAVAAKTWTPEWQSDDTPRWLLNNHEMLGDANTAERDKVLRDFCPDALVIDELHQCKVRDQTTESQRHRNLAALAQWAHTNGAMLYGMSGTPLVNELSEVIDLIRMVNPELAAGLKTQRTIDNCRLVHEALQPISSRFVPTPPAELRHQEIEVRADHLLDEVLDACEASMTTVDAKIAPAKFNALVDLAKQDGKLLVFSSAVTGVMAEAKALLAKHGINAVIHSGEDKLTDQGQKSVDAFQLDPSVKVLIASTSTLATGFDGLQKACNRIAFLTLPWTAAEYEQAVARLIRQGTVFDHVDVAVLVASLTDPETGEDWSLDRQKLQRLTTKRSMAAAVCDGAIPEKAALVCTEEKVRKAHRAWAKRVKEAARQSAEVLATA